MADSLLQNIIFFNLISGNQTILEKEPLESATKKGNFMLLNTKVFGNAWILLGIKMF